MSASSVQPARAVVLAPRGRDASVAATMLREAGIETLRCADLPQLEAALNEEALFALVAEEALWGADLRGVLARLADQPAWSDLPVIVLTQRGTLPEDPDTLRLAQPLGNVTFLERPFHPGTFLSVARTAQKARLRQYEVRARVGELRESEERLRTALVAGRLGSWELTLATRRFNASATCKAHFGRGDGSFGFDDLMNSIHAGDRDRLRQQVQELLEHDGDFAAECRTLWPDGTTHWADIRARLVRDRLGPRLVGVSSDISERKEAEARLRRLNESLEERVAARTGELKAAHAARLAEIEQREYAERQLRHAQKMETIGQLTGGIAHDFNNLLMAVLGNLELLRKRMPDDPKTMRLIESALAGAQRGASLTQRLLAFAHRQELKVEPHNLAELVRSMADLIENSIGTTVDLEFRLPATQAFALVDANQVELAVLNLVVNARDAMPNGGLLTISVDHGDGVGAAGLTPERFLRIVVEDTGHGMDAETLQKAAEPFFSTKERGKGTGLGLSMIHGLAVQLNGQLRLSSVVGRGTRAELWLPEVTATLAPAPEHKANGMPVAPTSGATILVVDDDALILMSTVAMLEDLGHRVLDAGSGARALEILRSAQAIDLLMTDYAMPRMNGAQLVDAARRLRPRIPVLLATGYAELPPGSTLDVPRLGKPYLQDQLAASIDRLLAAGHPAGAAATLVPEGSSR